MSAGKHKPSLMFILRVRGWLLALVLHGIDEAKIVQEYSSLPTEYTGSMNVWECNKQALLGGEGKNFQLDLYAL